MRGMPRRRVIPTSVSAVRIIRSSCSMTHGPAMRASGCPSPIVIPDTVARRELGETGVVMTRPVYNTRPGDPPSMPLQTGSRLGPYEILSPIGAGGMGEVYRANDTRLERIVAIKVLPAGAADNVDLRERF